MSAERYAGTEGLARQRADETLNSGQARLDAETARRDLLVRLPYGRALDVEDLASMCDEGNQMNRAIVLRAALLAEIRKALPGGVLITHAELEVLRADSLEHPTRPGPCLKVREWPAAQ